MIRISFIAALGLMAAACATPRTPEAIAARTPLDQFPPMVTNAPDETALAVNPAGVTATQAAALQLAAARWRDGGSEPITLRTPRGPNDPASYAMAESVRGVLAANGVPAERIRMEGYDAQGDVRAPLVVSFSQYRAVIPECGRSWDNLTATASNNNMANFGCANAANLAAMVANPADLVHMRASDPTDAARRQVVLEKYRAGEKTSAADSGASGAISSAVN